MSIVKVVAGIKARAAKINEIIDALELGHNHNGDNSAQVPHSALLENGTRNHAQIDAALDAAAEHAAADDGIHGMPPKVGDFETWVVGGSTWHITIPNGGMQQAIIECGQFSISNDGSFRPTIADRFRRIDTRYPWQVVWSMINHDKDQTARAVLYKSSDGWHRFHVFTAATSGYEHTITFIAWGTPLTEAHPPDYTPVYK